MLYEELKPTDSHVSFYKKAYIIHAENSVDFLQSYNTIIGVRVLVVENEKLTWKIFRFWDDWSATTGRHIKAFFDLNKKEFFSLEITDFSNFLVKYFPIREDRKKTIELLANRPVVEIKEYGYYGY